jgi:ATP diphosphatase
MAEEAGLFAFDDVATALSDKMVSRHPHVFGDAELRDVAAQTRAWEEHKAAERQRKAAGKAPGVLDDVPVNLPALARAQKIQKRASRVGFDWGDAGPALDKVEEEVRELRAELADRNTPRERVEDEIGDLLFAVVNVGRLAGADAETALRRGTLKFERRFRRIEAKLRDRGRTPEQSTLAEMDALWNDVKAEEKARQD